MISSPPNPPCHYYRGAVYLNNTGVALLEQGAYEQALETLRDAVFVTKTLCASSCPASGLLPTDIIDRMDLSGRIQQANQRIAFPKPCRPVTPTAFGLLTLEDYRQFEFDAHLYHHSNHSLFCPVRMDDSSTLDDLDFDSAIMLYNLGLAYACLARCQSESNHRDQLYRAAGRLFTLADSIIHQCQTESTSKLMSDCDCAYDYDVDHHRLEYMTSVNIAVLHSLLQVMVATATNDDDPSSQQQDDVVFQQQLDRLYMLQHAILFDLNTTQEWWCSSQYLPAAAA